MRRRRKSQRVKIEELHTEACQRGDDTYIDPTTGLSVFTRLAHERRGKCCGCGCRHCPYRGNEVSSKNETQNIKTQNIETQNIEDIGEPKTKITSVYTKTGDKGESSLFNGERKHKSNATFDALGDIDELTANIGIAYEKCCKISKLGETCKQLEWCMTMLLNVGSHVATPRSRSSALKLARTDIDAKSVKTLESWIDEMQSKLPRLTNFLVPIGGEACTALHVARCVCRRAERTILKLPETDISETCIKFMNRLSDYLFMTARLARAAESRDEITYGRARGESRRTLRRISSNTITTSSLFKSISSNVHSFITILECTGLAILLMLGGAFIFSSVS